MWQIISRCIESISSKIVVDSVKVDWAFSYSRVSIALDHVSVSQPASPGIWTGISGCPAWMAPVPKDWWVEDICDLDIDLFWRVMVAAKSKGLSGNLVGEALKVYAQRWLPGVADEHSIVVNNNINTSSLSADYILEAQKHRQMLETIVSLLPVENGCFSPCAFLLKLLKAATFLNASGVTKEELARRIGMQLEDAMVRDLLIPSLPHMHEMYDVDAVIQLVEHFLMQNQSPPSTPPAAESFPFDPKRRTRSTESLPDLVDGRHGAKHKVAKLIDSYLAEIAKDPNLPLAKFIHLAESIPDVARTFHDGLYRAVDMYLKVRSWIVLRGRCEFFSGGCLAESVLRGNCLAGTPRDAKERSEKICRLMDCRKLSMDACMHAAQNERLPLRTVVQVGAFHNTIHCKTILQSRRQLVRDAAPTRCWQCR